MNWRTIDERTSVAIVLIGLVTGLWLFGYNVRRGDWPFVGVSLFIVAAWTFSVIMKLRTRKWRRKTEEWRQEMQQAVEKLVETVQGKGWRN